MADDLMRVALETLDEPVYLIPEYIVLIEPAKGDSKAKGAKRILHLGLFGGHVARVLDTPKNRELMRCPHKA
jgi:hypothetical protein